MTKEEFIKKIEGIRGGLIDNLLIHYEVGNIKGILEKLGYNSIVEKINELYLFRDNCKLIGGCILSTDDENQIQGKKAEIGRKISELFGVIGSLSEEQFQEKIGNKKIEASLKKEEVGNKKEKLFPWIEEDYTIVDIIVVVFKLIFFLIISPFYIGYLLLKLMWKHKIISFILGIFIAYILNKIFDVTKILDPTINIIAEYINQNLKK